LYFIRVIFIHREKYFVSGSILLIIQIWSQVFIHVSQWKRLNDYVRYEFDKLNGKNVKGLTKEIDEMENRIKKYKKSL
jgi:hypothetical protein